MCVYICACMPGVHACTVCACLGCLCVYGVWCLLLVPGRGAAAAVGRAAAPLLPGWLRAALCSRFSLLFSLGSLSSKNRREQNSENLYVLLQAVKTFVSLLFL